MRALAASLAAVLSAVLLASAATATTVPPLTNAELVERSDLVARVVVHAHETAWEGRRILTYYELEVVDAWVSKSAETPRTALLAMPGGIVGDIGQRVAGTPTLVDGQTYVVCLSKAVGPRGARAVIGLWLGLWRVDEDGALRGFSHDGPLVRPVDLGALRRELALPLGITR